MADEKGKVVTLGGKPITDLRVVDLKRELEERKLSKSGSKKELIDRLRGHLNLERLREKSLQEGDAAPSIQVRDVVENDFIKQYMQGRDKMFEIGMQEKKKIVEEEKRKRESASEDESITPRKRSAESTSEDEPNSESISRRSKPFASDEREGPSKRRDFPEPNQEKSPRKLTRHSLRELGSDRKSLRTSLEAGESHSDVQSEKQKRFSDVTESENKDGKQNKKHDSESIRKEIQERDEMKQNATDIEKEKQNERTKMERDEKAKTELEAAEKAEARKTYEKAKGKEAADKLSVDKAATQKAEVNEAEDQARKKKEATEKERKEKEAAEKERKEKEAVEKAKKEKEILEKEKKEKDAIEKARNQKDAAEKEQKEKEAAEKARKEKEMAEKAKKEREAAEKAKKEKDAAEKAKKEKEAAEMAKKEKDMAEMAKKERDMAEKAKKEREAAEKAKKEKDATEKAKKEKEAAEKAKKEKEVEEKVKKQKEASEKAKKEKEVQEKAKKEKEAADKAKKEKEMADRAKQEKEAAEKAKEKEASEKKRKEKEASEKAEKEKNATEKAKKEKEVIDQARESVSGVHEDDAIKKIGKRIAQDKETEMNPLKDHSDSVRRKDVTPILERFQIPVSQNISSSERSRKKSRHDSSSSSSSSSSQSSDEDDVLDRQTSKKHKLLEDAQAGILPSQSERDSRKPAPAKTQEEKEIKPPATNKNAESMSVESEVNAAESFTKEANEPPAKKSRRSRSRSSSSSSSSRSRSGSRSPSSSRSSSSSSRSSSDPGSRSPSPVTKQTSGRRDIGDESFGAKDESYHTAREDISLDYDKDKIHTEVTPVKATESMEVEITDGKDGAKASSVTCEKTANKENVPRPPHVRKRKWGSTRSSANKSTISISTDSLKDIIDIKPGALATEPVLELGITNMTDELDDDNEEKPQAKENVMKICRTVVQDVTKKRKTEVSGEAIATAPVEATEDQRHVSMDTATDLTQNGGTEEDDKKTTKSEEVENLSSEAKPLRRIISRDTKDKPVAVLPVDEPQAPPRTPSPSRRPVSCIIHVRHLVRPYTLGQLKELLGRTGTVLTDGFWIDKIKSHCFAVYESEDQASQTRQALHGCRWPSSNPKVLWVDFATQEEYDFCKNGEEGTFKPKPTQREKNEKTEKTEKHTKREKSPPAPREREREKERERERDRRAKPTDALERDTAREKRRQEVREWDRDKIRQSASRSRSRSRENRRRRRPSGEHEKRDEKRKDRSGERRERKEKKVEEEPPAKLLDDLFRKTKATPCIYWLPLTEEQIIERQKMKQERVIQEEKEREERQKKMAAERKLREESRQEHMREQRGRRSQNRSRERRSAGNRRR